MTEPTFRRCYRILGCSSDVTLDALRLSYRRRARATHPDRYQFRNPTRAAALEAEFKQVVFAYRQIAAFARHHGHLPDPDLPLAGSLAIEIPPEVQKPATSPNAPGILRQPAVWALAGVVAAVALATGYRIGAQSHPPASAATAAKQNLSMGMPMQNVVEIEGIPTQTVGPRWFYGESVVLLDNGTLVGWQSRAPSPLHAVPDCAYALPAPLTQSDAVVNCRINLPEPTAPYSR